MSTTNIQITIGAFLILLWFWWYTRNTSIVRIKKGQIFNFKQSVELSGLAVITLYQNSKKYHFLVDTGSNVSHIHSGCDIVIDSFEEGTDSVSGLSGDVECKKCNITLYHGKDKLAFVFRHSDMSFVCQGIKETYGVSIDGIIGTDFMSKYNYCIDFKEFVVYERK